jgi:hypothetical protein
MGAEGKRHGARAVADGDVDLDGQDDQVHDTHVQEPDAERTFGYSPGRKTVPLCLRGRRAPHGVTLCDYRLERNACRDQ